jgi:hypothetical protein
MLSNGGGVAPQMRPCDGEEYQRRQRPAQAGERYGRDCADDSPAEHEIAGPEYRGQSEKQPRPIEERSQFSIPTLSSDAGNKHMKATICFLTCYFSPWRRDAP